MGEEKCTKNNKACQNVLSKNHFILKVFVSFAEFCSGEVRFST